MTKAKQVAKNTNARRVRRTPEEARTLALASARRLLLADGPDAITLQSVATDLGMSHTNLIHHFGSAAGLQSELMRQMMSELTAAMGINSPSLYAAFGSKEALFLEATDFYSRTEGADIWMALEEAPTARQAIEQFLCLTAKAYAQTDRPQGCLITLGALHQD